MDTDGFKDYMDLLCQDILKHKSKLGGNWVVAASCEEKCFRDFIKGKIGSAVNIVVLELDKNTKLQRLNKSYAGSTGDITAGARAKLEKQLEVLNTLAEPVDENEPDTFTIQVMEDTSSNDIANSILQIVSKPKA